MDRLYYDVVSVADAELIIASTDQGLAFVGSPNAGLEEIQKFYPTYELVQDSGLNKSVSQRLNSYFQGQNVLEEIQCDIHGTDFQESVWSALRNVPYGTTQTYQQIADAIGKPKAARAVGTAIGRNPVLMVVPCHRIVSKNKGGSGYRGGLEMKKRLLELER
ncbi:methylated-DNA--[protein]-cysteine S-methyltransferase [Weissella minor]|uniref:methylated-DNA--[protein]-cysteine S-methyltransferase n=1 Tax=Weissella minor TaxID=1620 RepID=A0A0R2JN97_9LACO|nr:methylated-DNA--[protein]-cysteine S-methyltransferase [Weissella minor]KRN75930.1 ogt protein [Weissella minor]